MDLATIIGIVLGFGLIIGSIFMGGSILLFVDVPSLMIVVGGTIAATLIKSPIGEVMGVFSVIRNAFQTHENETEALIQKVSDLAVKARKDGVLGLAKEPIDFVFLQRGIQLVADGVTADMVRNILKTEVAFLGNRHRRGKKILAGMGESSPAMGMIGTLIGLVAMLANLDNPSSIGPAMAVALLTTFYGSVLANLLFLPIADKLSARSEDEQLLYSMAIEGILSIQAGDNPRITEEKMKSFLPPKERGGA